LVIGDEWIPREAARLGGEVVHGGGLLANMAILDGPGFAAADPAGVGTTDGNVRR
jgi:hypothetical protein